MKVPFVIDGRELVVTASVGVAIYPDDTGSRMDASELLRKSDAAMGHSMGLRVVAEGVETEAQASHLKEIGCDYAQGYLYSRPVAADDITRMLS